MPWAECATDELRPDVHNGLVLSALWDAAFDAGLVSFTEDGTVIASSNVSKDAAAVLGLDSGAKLMGLTAAHRVNLKWRRARYGF